MDIVGILGTLLGIYFYFKSIKEKRPVFVFEHTLLQTRSYPGITIHFQNEKVENLRKLRVLFFNKGRKEIRSEDRPKTGFPKVRFPEGTRILDINLLGVSCQENGITAIKVNNSILEISFDYLNHGDGVVVEVLFDGGEVEKPEIKFNAPLVGAVPERSYRYVAYKQSPKLLSSLFMAAMLLFIGFKGGVVLLGSIKKAYDGIFDVEIIQGLGLGLVISLFVVLGIWITFVKPFQDAVPKWAKKHFGNA